MKTFMKRTFSFVIVLAMLLCVLPKMAIKPEAASYTYNWGARGVLATELSDMAVAWYEDQGVTYDELAQYTGSSTVSSVPSSTLYTNLRTLMRGAVTYTNSYDAIKELCQYTDCQNGGGKISSFYSGTEVGPEWDGTWNREHTWPNSKGDANGNGENDIFMIRPTSYAENSSRGNTAYGESSGYYHPNSEADGAYDLRGDVARIILFVYVRWQDTSNSAAVLFGSSGVMESKEVLLTWMEEDPVDTWELGRNDSCQSITGTRNVFVDYPELGFQLFAEDVPSDYDSPSGGGVSYTVSATTNNSSYGTVSVSGKTITATPNTGYYASGYKVTSGTATVTQSGNTFTVTASGDCTVQIIFAAKTSHTVTYMASGAQYSTSSAYSEDVISVLSYTHTAPDGYTFKGWVTSAITTDTTEKPTIYAAGDTYTVTADTTFYALFSYTEGGTGETQYVLTDLSEIGSTDSTVITVTTSAGTVYAMSNDKGTSAAPTAVTVSVSDDGTTLADEPDANLKWNVGGSADAYIFYPEDNASVWLYCTSANNGVRVGTTENNTFKIDSASGYLYHNGTNRYIGVYTSNPDWRCYTNYTGNIANETLGFYVQQEAGTVYYTTNPVNCEHSNVTNVAAVAATCTETGYTAGEYCNDCESYISGHELVAALGHSYNSGVVTTAPTCTETGVKTYTCSVCGDVYTEDVAANGHSYETVVTPPTTYEQGYTTYTCSVCGDSYVSDYVEALGETYIVSFSVPDGVDAVSQMECGKDGITLPTAGVPTGDYTYTFIGWGAETVEDTADVPTVYNAGDTYTASAATTLYAVYSYTVADGNSNAGEYALYSGALTEGDYVIVYNACAMVAADADSSGRMDYASITVTDDGTIQNPDATIVWHIAPDGDYWTIYNEENAVYAAGTGAKNKSTVISDLTDYGRWTASGDSTYEFINLGNSNKGVNAYLRCNGTVGFACYSTSTGGSLSLYKGSSGTTYYTTVSSASCAHTDTTTTTVNATCTEAGSVTVTCASCGEVVSTSEISATGHTVVTDEAVDATCTDTGLTAGSHCGVCNEVIVAQTEVEALGHSYGEWSVDLSPTYTAAGAQSKTCATCGDVVTEEIAVLENPVTEYGVVLGDSIDLIFALNIDASAVTGVTVNGQSVSYEVTDGKICVELAAAQMADAVALTVNGMALANTYSVCGYAATVLAGTYSNATKELVQAMLIYGAAAQTAFAYNTENPATAETSSAEVPTETSGATYTGAVGDLSFYGASLIYRNKTAVRFYFKGNSDSLTFTVDDSQFEPVTKNGMFYIEIADINPQDLDSAVALTVTDGTDTLTVSYSPVDYIIRMYNKESTDASTKALVQALYGYHLAAVEYIDAESGTENDMPEDVFG